MTLKNFTKRHALLTYFILAYLIAWGGILLAIGPDGLEPAANRPLQPGLLVFLAMLLGPSVAGLMLTAVLAGQTSLKQLLARWWHWRLPLRWYALALFTTPLTLLILGVLLAFVSSVFMPHLLTTSDKAAILSFGLTAGFLAGFFEEIGWSGFALPRLLSRYNVLKSGLILGVIWGVWHLLGDYWGNAGAFGSLYVMRGLLWMLTLTAYRTLMVYLYTKTESVLLMQLMHAAFTGGQIMLEPPLAPADYLVWYGVFSAVLWCLVAWVIVNQQRASHSLRPQMGQL